LSLASDIELPALDAAHEENDFLYEWGGALRWLNSDASAEMIQSIAADVDGQATLYRGRDRQGLFQPLTPGLLRIHKNLKQAFDPGNILNPGKLYPDL